MPPEAKVQTRAGAEAFVKYYFEMVNLAWTTPDPTALADLGDRGCTSCAQTEDYARELAKDGHRFESDALEVRSLVARGGAPTDQEYFTASIRQLDVDVIDGKGKSVEPQGQEDLKRRVAVAWESGEWYMYETSA